MNEPFDKDALLEELEHDRAFLAETFQMFTEDAGELLERLSKATAESDSGTVASVAHTLKSMVGNFCAAPAQQAALDLELLGKSGDLTDVAAKLERLQLEVDRLKRALGELLKGME